MTRLENVMVAANLHREVPSFFVECLVHNELEGAEPSDDSERWLDVNECKYLFHYSQK